MVCSIGIKLLSKALKTKTTQIFTNKINTLSRLISQLLRIIWWVAISFCWWKIGMNIFDCSVWYISGLLPGRCQNLWNSSWVNQKSSSSSHSFRLLVQHFGTNWLSWKSMWTDWMMHVGQLMPFTPIRIQRNVSSKLTPLLSIGLLF